ncbi:MAG: molybdate ABC transporter substrate-binding protein [Flavobacteriia bacterium]|nr:molybdate ABC transporter substrate-binding protein [Flavobacteriia bacterium]
MVKYYLFFITLLLFCFTTEQKPVRIAVSANMEAVISEVIENYNKKYPAQKIEPIISSSGKLFAQIVNGAPFDIFVSADMEYPNELKKKGKVDGDVLNYANGTMVLWTKKEWNLKKIDLLTEKIQKIAIANPETAPYGKAAVEYLKKKGIYEKVKSKLVFGESISQVNHFVTTKVVDLGFTSSSVVSTTKENYLEIDRKMYQAIEQGMCLLKQDQNNKNVPLFYGYLQSKATQKVLEKYGYIVH